MQTTFLYLNIGLLKKMDRVEKNISGIARRYGHLLSPVKNKNGERDKEAKMSKVYKNYINGKWQVSNSGETFENINPSNTKQVLGRFQKSNKTDVNKAISGAKDAQIKWRNTPAPKRGEMLFRAGEMLLKNKDSLAKDMTMEMGKVFKEAGGDVQEGIDMAYYAAGEGRRLMGETVPSEMINKFCMSIRIPVGIVAAITPWNFPMAIPTWKLFPALIAGNTVILKPASDTPLSAVNLVKVLEKAGFPAGVINLVTGTGEETGEPLIDHPNVNLVSFTGSTNTGSFVAEHCAKGMKKFSLEMGGKNAVIVMDDANLNSAVEGVLWGAFGTTGQRCTACSRVIVHKKVIKKFNDLLISRASSLRVGEGLNGKVEMGPLINESQRQKVKKYVDIGVEEGAKLLTGGDYCHGKSFQNGFFFLPTVFGDVSPKMRIAQEEIFGPVLSVISCNSLEQAVSIVNDSKFGLSSAIYTQDVNRAFKAIERLDTGITYINSSTIGAEIQLPFGGTKGTGNGHREAGSVGVDVFTEWKSVYVDYSGKLQKAQID
jgi:alpha-ketoglutaric semialdehyde dehydrogenase